MRAQERHQQFQFHRCLAKLRTHADRGGVQPDRGSMADDSMQEAMRDAGALGADAVARQKRTRQHNCSDEVVLLV